MSREKVKEIVDYMVSEGMRNANYGGWAFGYSGTLRQV